QGRDDGATPFTRSNFRGRSSSAERSFDMREVKRAARFAPTISVDAVRQSRPTSLCSRAAERPLCLENKLELPFQVHVPERVIQCSVTNHLIVLCAWTATRLGILVFDAGVIFTQRHSAK